MNFSKHCDLCENELTSLKIGVTCKLTSKKPEFENTCSNIDLNEKFQKKIEQINLDLEIIKRTKNTVYTIFYLFIFIGFFLIIGANTFLERSYQSVYTFYYTFGTISAGITFLALGYDKLNKFRRKLYNAKIVKKEIDEFFKKYSLTYTTNFDFKEKIHGIQEVIVQIDFKNWRKTQTITTYKVND